MISNIDENKTRLFELYIIIPKMMYFLYHNLKLHEIIDINSKYDNMHTNGMVYALIYINNHVNSCINYMLSVCIFNFSSYFFTSHMIEPLNHTVSEIYCSLLSDFAFSVSCLLNFTSSKQYYSFKPYIQK